MEESSILLRKDTKKKYNFEELVLTELNYLNHLKALVNLKHAVLNAEQPGGPVLPKNVAKIVFCNFEKIYKIHQKLAEVMKDNLSEWENNVTPSMKVIIRNKSEMLEEYEFYSKNVEVSQEAYQQCENENYHFRELTYLHRFDKIDIKDVFVRPFQRMCSISLLLGEMKKNIREKSEDRESLSEAINIIREILDKMNMEKRETDKLRMIFNIFYSIENCPNDLITSRRDFIVQFFAQEITKRVDSNNLLGINLSFFLFGDILMITKLRKSQSPKPYKYLVTLSLCMIVKILLFEKVDDTEVFGFVTRNLTDENKTTTCCFQYVKKDRLELNDVLLMIAKQISLRSCQLSAEDYIVRGISTSRITVQSLHNTAKIKSQSGLGIVKLVTQKLFGNPKSNADEQNIKFRRSRSCSELNI